VAGGIEDERRILRGGELRRGSRAAQQRADADDQFGERERLGHVVVPAGVKAAQPIGERVACGEEQNRTRVTAGAERLADVAPVGVGQADVEHEHIGRVVREHGDRFGARCSRPDTVTLPLECGADDPA
jgi:hypothetical protein